jgi:hypothetical protein
MPNTENKKSNIKYQNCGICQRQIVSLLPYIIISLILMPFFAGCQEKQKAETPKAALAETKAPAKSTAKLSDEVAQLTKQVEGLMGINKEARTAALSTLKAVELSSKSGLYTNDKTKKKDRLVVYLKPIDDMGDAVKAAGEVNVELWNLNAKPENAMVAQWKVTPEELKKKWTSSLMSTHYKLDFDVSSKLLGKEKELTLKTQFTDYLTGKVFKSQLVINK